MKHSRPAPKRALITGITGQDGSYLAELLLSKGYEVHGLMRRASSFNRGRIDHLFRDPAVEGRRFFRHYGDLTDESSLRRVLRVARPGEIYNLGAQSHVRVSFDMPLYTLEADGLGVLRLLEAVRGSGLAPRIYQASSSEMYGSSPPPQDEGTPFHPRSPYGCAKVMAFHQVRHYREAFGMFAVNGILFNHESPRRGESFVTRKITRAAGRIRLGLQDHVVLGNLDARRDWGFAGDHVRAMWLMLQQDEPEDLVIGTGASHSVREFCAAAFGRLGLDWRRHVRRDDRYLRPSEVDHLRADPSRARRLLGWKPEVGFEELVAMMVDNDLRLAERERILRDTGHAVREGGDA